ncbi:MAG: hypothetical protein KAQ79_17105, partial [Cyclobacteriaceae bacterium]|nr:hypothetical protein [Cyclobacteriaceae bacterium]
ATVNLTLLNTDISGGTGTVSWFSDADLDNSIDNPASYVITDNVPVYALVNNSNCTNSAQVVYGINSKPNSLGFSPQNYNEDQIVSDIDLTDTFFDTEDGFNLTFSIQNITVSGILNAVVSNEFLSITLLSNQSGSTTITIRATDTQGAFVEDDLDITVDPVNDLPSSSDKTVSTNEDIDYSFISSDFAFADVETPSLVSINIVSLPGDGQLLLSSSPVSAGQNIPVASIGNLAFSPDANESGTPYTSFLFTVSDGTDDSSPANTITVNVNPVNDPPTSANNLFTTDEDIIYAFENTDFPFFDTDGGSLTQVKIETLPSSGQLKLNSSLIAPNTYIPIASINANLFTYTPELNVNGTSFSPFTFEVNDGQDDSDGNYVMTITVNAVNDKPTFDLKASHSSNENDNTQTEAGFATNVDDGDPEATQSITFHVTQTGSTGILEFDQAPTFILVGTNGTLSYKSKPNTNGSATFDVYCSDSGLPGQNSIVKSFTINVSGENSPPSFDLNGNPPTVNEDPGDVTEPAFALNIDDGDDELNQNLTFNLVKTSGSLLFSTEPAINASSGDLSYT